MKNVKKVDDGLYYIDEKAKVSDMIHENNYLGETYIIKRYSINKYISTL